MCLMGLLPSDDTMRVKTFDGFSAGETIKVTITDLILISNPAGDKYDPVWVFTTHQGRKIWTSWLEGKRVGNICRRSDFQQLIEGTDAHDVRHYGTACELWARMKEDAISSETGELTKGFVKQYFVGKTIVVTVQEGFKVPYIEDGKTRTSKAGKACQVFRLDLDGGSETPLKYIDVLKESCK